MKAFYKKKYINCEINNQFNLFFVVASTLQSLHYIKLINIGNNNYLKKEDFLFTYFSKFIMNKPASLLNITYMPEYTKNDSTSMVKKFKNIKVGLGVKIANHINEKKLLHLAFVWNMLILKYKTSCKILSYFDFGDLDVLSYKIGKKSFAALYKFRDLWSLFLISTKARKKLINFSSSYSDFAAHTISLQLVFEQQGYILNRSFYMLLVNNEKTA